MCKSIPDLLEMSPLHLSRSPADGAGLLAVTPALTPPAGPAPGLQSRPPTPRGCGATGQVTAVPRTLGEPWCCGAGECPLGHPRQPSGAVRLATPPGLLQKP